MIILIPEDNSVGEIVLIVEPISSNVAKTKNLIFFSKAMLEQFGLEGFDKDSYYTYFKSIKFYEYLKALDKIIKLDKKNSKTRGLNQSPFDHLEYVIPRALKAIENQERLNIIFIPENVEKFSIKTKNNEGNIVSINFDIQKGADFTNDQKFIEILNSSEGSNYFYQFLNYVNSGRFGGGRWFKEIFINVLNNLDSNNGDRHQ